MKQAGALFFLSLIMGLLLINEGLFHYDAVKLAQAVEKTYATARLEPATVGRYGAVILSAIVYFPFFLFKQNADFAVRLTTVIFYALSVAMLFIFIKELTRDSLQAIFASLLFCFTPFYFMPNTYGKEHGMAMFFLLLSFYLVYKGGVKKSAWFLGASGLAFIFSLTIRESILIVVPLLFLLYLRPEISLRPLKIRIPQDCFSPRLFLSFILPLILGFCFIFFIYFKSSLYRALFMRDTASTYFIGLFSRSLMAALRDLSLTMPILLFLFFIFGVVRFKRQGSNFLVTFFLVWLMSIFYFANTNTYCARYLDIVIVPIYFFAAYILAGLYKKDKIIALSIMVYFILSMVIFMYPMLEFRHGYNGEKQFALYVKEKTESNALIIAMDDAPFIEYYAKRQNMVHSVDGIKEAQKFINDVEVRLKENLPVYLIESGFSYDAKGIFKKAIGENFNLAIIGEKLAEDYHRPEMGFQIYNQKLFKILPKG